MKQILILGVLAFLGWKIYQEKVMSHGARWGDYKVEKIGVSADGMETIKLSPTKGTAKSRHDSYQAFKCDGRQYCSQMTSREEAVFFTRNCPNTKMDGDGDGIPCENDSRF